jgi:hypothetical protein
MDPAAAYELYKRKVFGQAELTAADDGLFAAMRAEDKKANLRLILGISRWVIDRIDAIPGEKKLALDRDPLSILTQANSVVSAQLRAYRGGSVEEFRALLMPALESRIHAIFGQKT